MNPNRIVARYLDKLADLHPALGKPGGPEQVVRRIEEEVKNPRLQETMIDEVQRGKDLSNPEAASVYDIDREMGNKLIKRIEIGPHAQYRMDLRSITVDDIKNYFDEFAKLYQRLATNGGEVYQGWAQALTQGTKIEWAEPKSQLFVTFAVKNGLAKVITTYHRN